MSDEKLIATTIKVQLKPWTTPNFVNRFGAVDSEITSIPLKELNDEALEDLVLTWVREVYSKAGRRHCPFYKPAREAPPLTSSECAALLRALQSPAQENRKDVS